MTPQMAIRKEIFAMAIEWNDKIEDVELTEDNVDELFEKYQDYIQDATSETRCGSGETNIPANGGRHYEAKSVMMYCGDVFYGDQRINNKVKTVSDVINNLKSDFAPDLETTYRFLYYLIYEFYSFGHFKTHQIPWEDGDSFNAEPAILDGLDW